jgi:hypothetical protein
MLTTDIDRGWREAVDRGWREVVGRGSREPVEQPLD